MQKIFIFFSEFYDGSIFETSELKKKLPELQNCWGLPWNLGKHMFLDFQCRISSEISNLCFGLKKIQLYPANFWHSINDEGGSQQDKLWENFVRFMFLQ